MCENLAGPPGMAKVCVKPTSAMQPISTTFSTNPFVNLDHFGQNRNIRFPLSGDLKMKRRTFLKSTAATVAVSAMTLDAKTYAQIPGANEAIGLAFLGVGGRCQQHIDVI